MGLTGLLLVLTSAALASDEGAPGRCEAVRWVASGAPAEALADGCTLEALTAPGKAGKPRVGVWPHPTRVETATGVLEGLTWRPGRRRVHAAPVVHATHWAAATADDGGWRCEVAIGVDVEGRVTEATSGCEGALGAATARAAQAWRFEPLRVEGEPVAFHTTVVVPVEPARSTALRSAPSPWLGYESGLGIW